MVICNICFHEEKKILVFSGQGKKKKSTLSEAMSLAG